MQSLENDIEKQFNILASKWKKETGAFSTMIHKASNNNYLDIIGMGKPIVPFILRDLQQESNLWFAALKAITKENPVPREDMGNIEKMRLAWLNWGKNQQMI